MVTINNIPIQEVTPANVYMTELTSVQPFLYTGMKIILILFLIGYAIVAMLTLKQINLMTRTIKSYTNKYIYLIAYLHLAAVIICLVLAITIL